jgi:hypothetical protein
LIGASVDVTDAFSQLSLCASSSVWLHGWLMLNRIQKNAVRLLTTHGGGMMSRRAVGLFLLNAAGVLVIAGALYDLFVPSVPANHLSYLEVADGRLDPRYAELDLAMLRSIGGCLIAIGVTTLILANGPILRGERWARLALAVLVGVSEGNNAYRMYPFGSPWYGPLGFAVLALVGAALAGPPERAAAEQSDRGS